MRAFAVPGALEEGRLCKTSHGNSKSRNSEDDGDGDGEV